jgi:hypothetical protein
MPVEVDWCVDESRVAAGAVRDRLLMAPQFSTAVPASVPYFPKLGLSNTNVCPESVL